MRPRASPVETAHLKLSVSASVGHTTFAVWLGLLSPTLGKPLNTPSGIVSPMCGKSTKRLDAMSSKNSGLSQNSPDGRYVSVYSIVGGALEDDEIFPETDDGLVAADVFLADLVRKLKADC
jgi:hypothetical protein